MGNSSGKEEGYDEMIWEITWVWHKDSKVFSSGERHGSQIPLCPTPRETSPSIRPIYTREKKNKSLDR